ncbi:MAG: hypothetical protein AB7N76_30605 [Planctomycetota bacterium]
MIDPTGSDPTQPASEAPPAASSAGSKPAQPFAVHRSDPSQVEGGGAGGLLFGLAVVAACAAGAWHFARSSSVSGPATGPAVGPATPGKSPLPARPPQSPGAPVASATRGQRHESQPGHFALTLDPEWTQTRAAQGLLKVSTFFQRPKRHRLMVGLFLVLPWEDFKSGEWGKLEWREGQEVTDSQFNLRHRFPIERWALHRRGTTVYLYLAAGLRIWAFVYPIDSRQLVARALGTLELRLDPPWGKELLPRYQLSEAEAAGPPTKEQRKRLLDLVVRLGRMEGRAQAGMGGVQAG